MTTYKTSELEEQALDAAVCLAEGWTFFENKRGGWTIRKPDGNGYESGNYAPKFDPDTGNRLPPPSLINALTAYGECWSTNWELAGQIIERERIGLEPLTDGRWLAEMEHPAREDGVQRSFANGPTALTAACRAYVASKLGETVELP